MSGEGRVAPTDLDAHVRSMIRWHFDPATGSPYWLRKAASLGFDPLTEVQTFADLARFPPVADEWRTVPASDLIPRGCAGPFAVWETGGTTGAPRRIVDAHSRFQGLLRVNRVLDQHGFPGRRSDEGKAGAADLAAAGLIYGASVLAGDSGVRPDFGWLHLGPTGPHLVGTNMARLARLRGALFYTVDLDPRWVKRLYQEGRGQEARAYTAHLVEQALLILRTQPVRVITTTPPLLEALLAHPEAGRLVRTQVRGVIWFGTSMAEESLRLLEEDLLPGAVLVGWYGNTLMGIACQRPRRPGDPFRCIFVPPSPDAVVQLVDPGNPAVAVEYGKTGQVRLSVLTRELFLPWHLERDQAVRVPPAEPGDWDGLARVAPLGAGGPVVEGVY